MTELLQHGVGIKINVLDENSRAKPPGHKKTGPANGAGSCTAQQDRRTQALML